MIEIIQEEKEKEKGLPKEIRQIGNADIGDRIYVAENVYQYLHRKVAWSGETFEERKVFVLLGKLEDFQEQKCIFVEYALSLETMPMQEGLPVWSDSTWGYVFKKMKHFSEEMIVVGWAFDLKGGTPGMVHRLTQLHMTHFGGRHQVLFLMDSVEKEENFFCNRHGELSMREGFYLYHEKKALALAKEEDKPAEVTIEHEKVSKQEENNRMRFSKAAPVKEKRKRFSPTYALAIATLVLIFAAYRNNVRMKNLQETISQMNTAQTVFAETDSEQKVAIETLKGNVEKKTETSDALPATETTAQADETVQPDAAPAADTTTQTASAQPADAAAQPDNATQQGTTVQSDNTAQPDATTQADDASASQQTAVTNAANVSPEAKVYLDQGYYVVQKGDSLAGICMKLYQTNAMMDKLCEVNGIENADQIYEGQCLTLPR